MRGDNIAPELMTKHAILPKRKVTELILASQAGSVKARDVIIRHNLRFIRAMVDRYPTEIGREDLLQEAMRGLNEAITRFDVTTGFNFLSYATWWIKAFVDRYVCDKCRTIRAPGNTVTKYHRAKTKKAKGLKITDLEQTLIDTVEASEAISFDKLLPHGHDMTYADVLGQEPEIDAELHARDVTYLLRIKLDKLDKRSREIMAMWYGLSGAERMTLAEIGDRYGISRERARQIAKSAMDRMRGKGRTEAAIDLQLTTRGR
jgi:RNA polymerase primary sigma factor